MSISLIFLWALSAGCAGSGTKEAGRKAGEAETRAARKRREQSAANDERIRGALRLSVLPQERLTLIGQIEAGRQDQFLPDLVHLLWDGNEEVREASARAISSFGWERMSGPLVRVLGESAAPFYVRELALRTLVNTGRPEAVPALIDVALRPRAQGRVVGEHKPLDPPGADRGTGPVERLHATALAGLKELTFRDFETADDWRNWWQANRDRTREEWAASGTEELRARVEELEQELDALRKRSLDLEDRAADAIIRSLENRPDRNAALLIVTLDDSLPKVREYAASELAKLKAKEAVKRLSELAASDPSDVVRAECARALGEFGSQEVVPVLAAMLTDANEDVAAAAARALGRLKAAPTVNRLLLALLTRSTAVRKAAAEALGQMGAPAAVDPLMTLLTSDKESGVREQAARALGAIGDKRARTALELALDDGSPAVRVYAVEALGTLQATQSAGRISARLIGDDSPSVREAAAVALGEVGDARSLKVLMAVLDNPPSAVSSGPNGQGKLAQLAFTSIIAVCKRNEGLIEPTGDALASRPSAVSSGPNGSEAGLDQALTLYELLVQKLARGEEDGRPFGLELRAERLSRARMKLADGYVRLRQWTKAAPPLEELLKTLPEDAGVVERYARVLSELHRHGEAFRVYRDFATRTKTSGHWEERLGLLDAMLKDAKAAEAMQLIDESAGGEAGIPTDVRTRLDAVRRRCAEAAEVERIRRIGEIRRLVAELASQDEPLRTAARARLQASASEALPYLVEALERPDERLRRAAVELLRELAKQDFGYRPEGAVEENADALRKWKEWLKTVGGRSALSSRPKG